MVKSNKQSPKGVKMLKLGIGSKVEIADKVFTVTQIGKTHVTVTNGGLSRKLTLAYIEKHVK